MLWNTPRMWDGETCYILGGGTSLVKQFGIPESVVNDVFKGKLTPKAYLPYLASLKDKLVIGINKAYEFGDELIDILFWGDPGFWERYKKDILSFEGIRVTCSRMDQEVRGVKVLYKSKKKKFGLSLDESFVISFNKNSGAAAINLAAHLGAKRIVLLGFDMNLDAKKNQHWHKFYKSDSKTVHSVFQRQMVGFKRIQEDAEAAGIEILNANPESAIKCFKKINIDDVLESNKDKVNLLEKYYNWNNKDQIDNKICITTTFDRNYKEGGKTLFNSIRRHTNCTGVDFKVITSDLEVVKEFGKENCYFVNEEIRARYKNVKYFPDLPKERYESSWHRFEMFNMTEYDRVICIDSDCICIEDISYLFSKELNEYDLISVEDHIVSKSFTKSVPELKKLGLNLEGMMKRHKRGEIDIQPAVLIATKSILTGEWYRKLLKFANTSPFIYAIDEGILNTFIYQDKLRIKILPLEWDYQDVYETHVPNLRVPDRPIIVHCQQSKPFKKEKSQIDKRLVRWHDRWWKESKSIQKTIVAIIIWNRFENLELWINCWKQCNKSGAELVVIHNLEENNERYRQLCKNNGVTYVPRENKGFDIGSFQDVCSEKLVGFPNEWDNLIWCTDDCIPMDKNFVDKYLSKLTDNILPCYEISDIVKRHVRTTGFLVTKEISKKLKFPRTPMRTRKDCYQFEHKNKLALFEQLIKLGKKPVMVSKDLRTSPLWDSGVRKQLKLWDKHKEVFSVSKLDKLTEIIEYSILDEFAIKHKADKSSLFNNFAIKYDKILVSFRNEYQSILEIGICQGASLKMWDDYFLNAKIHGVDIPDAVKYGVNLAKAEKSCKAYSSRIKFHMVDQGDAAQLKNLEQFSPFNLIVDDGSHLWGDQILTFQIIFPYLKSGGIYIIEDTCTSYWPEYKKGSISCVNYFKGLVDEVNFKGARGLVPANPPLDFGCWEKGWHRREDCQAELPLFDSIQFQNGFIVITKR